MKGIIIAAGEGIRMQPFTHQRPKCMLDVRGRPLICHTLDALRGAGCEDITIVIGHLADKIHAPGCRMVRNTGYKNNNILHSLMYARDCLDHAVLVTYSDIYVNPEVHKQLTATSGDIVIVVDSDWETYYEGRTYHPPSEAEKAFVEMGTGHMGNVRTMGKHLNPTDANPYLCTEFLGLWKMTASGARKFRAHFEALEARLDPMTPFQSAKQWRKAYVTDFLMDLVACGTTVNCLVIERGWAELDTVQDYERLVAMASRQRLFFT